MYSRTRCKVPPWLQGTPITLHEYSIGTWHRLRGKQSSGGEHVHVCLFFQVSFSSLCTEEYFSTLYPSLSLLLSIKVPNTPKCLISPVSLLSRCVRQLQHLVCQRSSAISLLPLVLGILSDSSVHHWYPAANEHCQSHQCIMVNGQLDRGTAL